MGNGNKKLAILFFLSVLLAFFAGYFSSTIIENQSSVYSSEMFTDITDIFKQYYYYDIEDEEVNRAFITSMESIINQYASDNDDPYTRLQAIATSISPTDAEEFEGLGITFAFNDDHELVVYDVMNKSSLFGIVYPNDRIIGIVIDELPIMFADLTEDEVVQYFSGVAGETKTLIVENPDDNQFQVEATYKLIATPTAYDVDLNVDDVAYIKITEFSGYEQGVTLGTSQVFNNVLVQLEQSILTDESTTLIIDLRDNPGGSLSALNNIEDSSPAGITQQLLVKNLNNPLFTMTNRLGEMTSYYGRLSSPKTYDIKVLVNEHSASAAEVLAATLMTAGYDLYGSQTYGKGVYQNTIYLTNIYDVDYYLTYTEGTWEYGDQLNVMDTPLQVNEIEQTGMYAIDLPIYTGEVSRDEVSVGLPLYQMFLNTYFQFDEEDALRTDGYFDLATELAIIDFQTDMSIPTTGILDRNTAEAVFDYYNMVINDMAYDTQLQTLITQIEASMS